MSGYGTPAYIQRHWSWGAFNEHVDAAARRVHNERRFKFILAGGKPEDWTDYEGAGEALDEEAIERSLEANPLIHRVTG